MISDDNEKGLIPVGLSCFVIDGRVDTDKLQPILSKVEDAWQKRLKIEENREASGDWRSLLGKRISWPMSELD